MFRTKILLVMIGLAALPATGAAQFRWSRSTDERLAGVERRRFDVLALILEDAERAAERVDRARLYEEYLEKSELFLRDHPDSVSVWSGRAMAAVELNRSLLAWTAGQAMVRLGAARQDDRNVRRALAMLERRGWLGESAPQIGPRPTEPWENSLGMKFVPVEGTDVLFCVWETRVRDFTAFVEAAGYDATSGMLSFADADSTWHRRGASWRLPGFDQSGDHPVVGVNWYDANAFCAWLTLRERRAGVIAENQHYRLPYDAEWSAAIGPVTYAWGEQWPPPAGAGNFLGEEARPVQLRVLEGYHDGAPRTARVGQFSSNQFGLHDLAGNVQEWCEDLHGSDGSSGEAGPEKDAVARNVRTLRGASWSYQNATNLHTQRRHRADVDHRIDDVGFRCVIVTGGLVGTVTPEATIVQVPASDGGAASARTRRQPRPIHQVEPDFPPDRLVLQESGSVVVEFDIDETGRVRDAKVVSSTHQAFETPTLAAVRDWRFEPAQRDGRPIKCHASQRFNFNARNRSPITDP